MDGMDGKSDDEGMKKVEVRNGMDEKVWIGRARLQTT